jgi:hypothetical protein
MKKQILLLFLFLVYNFVSGQSTFTLLISDSSDDRPGDVIELSNHSFILSSGMVNTTTYQAAQRFFKINSEGIITQDSIFENSNGTGTLSALVYINDTNIFCIGEWVNLNEKGQIWIAGIDSGFNMYWNKKYQTNYNYPWNYAAFMNSQGKIIYGTSLYNNPPTGRYYLLLQEFSVTGDSIRSTIDSSVFGPLIFDMMEFPGNCTYRATTWGYGQNSMGQILIIDSTLKIIGIDSIPNSVNNYSTVKKVNDSSYYLSGNKYINGSYDYAIMLLNEKNDCMKIGILGQNDTIDYVAIQRSIDFSDKNKIFLGGTSNISLVDGAFGQQNSWYALSNFDSTLNLRWTKYYGGDAYYVLQSVVATQDGGAILVGTRYDYQSQSYKCGIYVVKVNENGILTNNDHNPLPLVHDAIVFPNPGSDYLIIESGQQISGAQFIMTTIDGKQVITKTLNERRITLETQSLLSGIYVWQIVLNDRIIETGKWIKE